jgi:hypothetical protein
MMSLDAPLFSLLTVDKNDDLWNRCLGEERANGKFDYLVSLKVQLIIMVFWHKKETDFALNNQG